MLDPPLNILKLLRDALPANGDTSSPASTPEEAEEILAYVATLAASLADEQNFQPTAWFDALSPYLSTNVVSGDDEAVEECVEKFRSLAETKLLDNDDSSDEEDEFGGEELTNIRFSLAYGGKILLHQTKLRLRRGHRYALVGQNGVGKTTLMNAINNGKLEGWPVELRTEFVDSGSNVDPVHEAKHVFEHLISSTGKSADKCRSMLEDFSFSQTLMDGTIGDLSGGWQMKLRLAKGILMDADIMLMDEPTNHLDSKTVSWLERYLQNLTQTTVLIVSHDTQFLENVCSDGELQD